MPEGLVKILVIDDQKLHALFVDEVLRGAGYKDVRCQIDPLQALSSVTEYRPDLVVLDLDMPKLDGFQVMTQLTDFRKNNYLPILTVYPDATPEVRLRALQFGATDFLSQPFEDEELVLRIGNMLQMRLLHTQVENQNRILEFRVKERTQELRDTQLEVIQRLAQAAEFRDNDTGRHIIRMSRYCALLGDLSGMSSEDCDLLLGASPLHDVGKIGIPDRILLKPGKLTPEEFEVMKTHTTIGAKLLSGSRSPIMQLAEQIAQTHHEKWDGTGYPLGLRGEEIPEVGRICSICDVFDALTSKRPYKKGWSVDDAAQEIARMNGTHFEPRFVELFLAHLEKFQDIQVRYAG